MSDRFDTLKHVCISGSMEVKVPRDPYQSLWMGHWKRTSCSSFPGTPHKHRAGHEELCKEEHADNLRDLPVRTAGTKETAAINPGPNHPNCSGMQNTSDRRGSHIASDIPPSSKGVIAGKGTDEILTEDNTKSFDAEAILAKTSVGRRLQSSPVDWATATPSPFLYSRNVFSERQNFTAFDINRKKMESVLASKKKTGYGATTAAGRINPQLTLREFTSARSELKSVAGDHRFREESIEQISARYKLLENKGLSCCETLPNGLLRSTSGSAFKEFIERPDIRPCICSGKESVHSFSGLEHKEQFATTSSFPMKQDVFDSCHCSTFMLSKTESDEEIILGSSWSRMKGGPLKLLTHAQTGGLHHQVLMGECGTGTKNISNGDLSTSCGRSIPRLTRLNDLQCKHNLQSRVPACSIHDVETVRIYTTMGSADRSPGVSSELSKTMRYLLITKKTDMDLSGGDQITREATFSAEPKEIVFFDQPTMPSRFCCCGKTPKSSTNEEKKDDKCNCFTHMMNKSSLKTDSMNIDVCCGTRSPAGTTSSKSKKRHAGSQNIKKCEATSVSLIQEVVNRNPETKQFDVNVESFPCLDTKNSVGGRESSTSRTESLIPKHDLLRAEKLETSNSNHQFGSHLDPDPSSKWVKRLKVNSDSPAIGTQSFNIEDALTSGRVHKLFSRVMNFSRSNSFTLAKCLQEHQQFQNTMVLLKNGDSSVESLKESHSWIRRWCRSSQENAQPWARQPVQVLCEPENTKAVPESFEGRLFPSLSAMALMGKAAKKFRPCEFRRRGSSLVWNTEGF